MLSIYLFKCSLDCPGSCTSAFGSRQFPRGSTHILFPVSELSLPAKTLYRVLHRNNKSLFKFIKAISNSAFTSHRCHSKFVILRQSTTLDICYAIVLASKPSSQRTEISISALQALEQIQRDSSQSTKSNAVLETPSYQALSLLSVQLPSCLSRSFWKMDHLQQNAWCPWIQP